MCSENDSQEKSTCLRVGEAQTLAGSTRYLAPLLVSVRSVAEARSVAKLPFQIMDLKEPSAGPLGACNAGVWREAVAIRDFPGTFSVALGEGRAACEIAEDVPQQVQFAKVGPAAINCVRALTSLWVDVRALLPSDTALVAVAYADHERADSLPIEKVLQCTIQTGLTTLLIDTYDKRGAGVFTLLGATRIAAILSTAKRLAVEVAIAGRLDMADCQTALSLGARWVGMRGALCRNARDGEIAPALVERLINSLSNQEPRVVKRTTTSNFGL